jgi:NADPH:quinone reductase-like Zn-dependent oxidoreductase
MTMLRAAGSLAGRRVLLTGASGGVGHLVVELAAAQGARTTAVTRTPERAERLLALGATDVVHDVDDAEGTFDVVFESVGGASLTEAIARLSPRGTVFWFGAASREAAALDFFALPQRAKLRRFSYWRHDEPDRVDLQALVDLVAAGRLHPEVGHLAGWRETPSALLALRDPRVRGNGAHADLVSARPLHSRTEPG